MLRQGAIRAGNIRASRPPMPAGKTHNATVTAVYALRGCAAYWPSACPSIQRAKHVGPDLFSGLAGQLLDEAHPMSRHPVPLGHCLPRCADALGQGPRPTRSLH